MNIQQIMRQAQEMQKKMENIQNQLAEREFQGSSGGNMVQITLNGKSEAKKVNIDASLLKPEEKEMLEDLLVAAFNNAKSQSEQQMGEEMSKLTAGIGLPPGFKLPI